MVTKCENTFRGGRNNRITPAHGRRCAAVILNRNGAALTRQCVDSLLAHAGAALAQIVLVDNGSEDPRELCWAEAYAQIKVVRSETNLGFSGGCNLGIRAADPQYDIWLLNNDTIIFPGALDALCSAFDHPRVGAAGSVSNNVRPTQKLYPRVKTYDRLADHFQAQPRDHQSCIREMRLSGFSVLIRREALEQVGLLDERFFPGGYEDDDYSLRLLQAGWLLEVCTGSIVYHIGSATLKQVSCVSESFDTNRARLEEKWGIREDALFDHSRYYLLTPEEMTWGSVLELGAHGGSWLAAVIAHGKVQTVAAVPRAARCSDFWDRSIVCYPQLEQVSGSYDAVFVSDMPREAFDPDFFRRCAALLNPAGRIYLRGHSQRYHGHLQKTREAGYLLPPLIPEVVLPAAEAAGLVSEGSRVISKPLADGGEYTQLLQLCLRRKEDR